MGSDGDEATSKWRRVVRGWGAVRVSSRARSSCGRRGWTERAMSRVDGNIEAIHCTSRVAEAVGRKKNEREDEREREPREKREMGG